MSEFADGVPSMVGTSLMKMAHVVAADLQEESLYDPAVAVEEDMGISMAYSQPSPLYIGFWEDSEGRPFYYDTRQQAYFYLERRQEPPEGEDEGPSERKDESGDDDNGGGERGGATESHTTKSTSLRTEEEEEEEEEEVPRAHSSTYFIDITSKIAEDLQVIYRNVTNSMEMLLVRGDTLEETRKKLDGIMETASSLERRSRCLTCAHRCNSFLPGTGFNFIMRIADRIPMSACCRGDGACGPYVLLSDDDEGGDEGEDMGNRFSSSTTTLDLREHHLE